MSYTESLMPIFSNIFIFLLEFSKSLKDILYILWILKKYFRLAIGQMEFK